MNQAIEKAREAGLEPEGLDPQPADAMPYRGLAHRADGSPTAAAQRNFTDPDSHIMKSDGNLAAVDGDHQVGDRGDGRQQPASRRGASGADAGAHHRQRH